MELNLIEVVILLLYIILRLGDFENHKCKIKNIL